MKPIMPFSCALTEVQTPQVKEVSANKNKSPLLLSDHNARFQFQTAPQRSRVALERNPLKIFQEPSKIMLPLARNMKMDMLEVSLKVKQQIFSKPKEEVRVNAPMVSIPGPSTSSQGIPKFQDRAVEAKMRCEKCVKREEAEKDAKSKKTQTDLIPRVDAGTQCASNDGSMTITIDADRLRKITFEEHHLLKDLSERFGFPYDGVSTSPARSASSSSRRNDRYDTPRFEDDRLNNFANPENPATAYDPFVTFSPPRNQQQSIFDRIGEKVQTLSPSPQAYYERVQEYRVPSPRQLSPVYRNRNRSRSLSPSNRLGGGRNRSPMRSRSPGRNQSPTTYRSFRSPLGRNRSPISRNRSPIQIVARNRSPIARNRSPMHSRETSPKRTRFDDWDLKELSVKDRRGRY